MKYLEATQIADAITSLRSNKANKVLEPRIMVRGEERSIRRVRRYPDDKDGIRRIRFEFRSGGGITVRHRVRLAVPNPPWKALYS